MQLCISSYHLLLFSPPFGPGTIGTSMATVIIACVMLLPIIGILVLGFRIRKFTDHFYIIKEFNVLSAYLVIFAITYIIIGGFVPAIFGVTAYARNLMVIIMYLLIVPTQYLHALHNHQIRK